MGRVLTWVGLLLTLTLLVVWPARAELQIHVSSLNPATMEPITLTVTDPRQGEGAGRTVEVTMADGSDRRFVLHLEPGPRPGTWVGRFTPPTPGRYTGTAVLERGDEKEIGLVPVIRVRAVRRPGFLRLSPTGSRTFRFTNGETLFPIGVRLFREDLLGNVDWIAEFHRLRSYSVN
ncbi:MAG: hypothetical protein FJX77_16135, partial [Armatimonadetes bacterium]|nr:hypothetical protein [Armatimonadota bacterium]